jgi:hypothetical protein
MLFIDSKKSHSDKKEIMLFKQADYKLINYHLAWVDWDMLLANKDTSKMVEAFNFVLNEIITKCIPKKQIGT